MSKIKSNEELTPDDLLSDFRGKSLFPIIIFTIVIHAVIFLGTSVPFLWRTLGGGDQSSLTEEERNEIAIKKATESLRRIASEHGLKPQDLSNQLGTAGSKRPNSSAATNSNKPPEPTGTEVEPSETTPVEPKAGIEKELDVKSKGPSLPAVPEDDDLFK